jgi:hypothetical protein
MDRFTDRWIRGTRSARRRLQASNPAAAVLANRLADVSFPGALALLADPRKSKQPKGGAFLADVATKVAATGAAKKLGLDEDAAEDLLRDLLIERRLPSRTGRRDEVLAKLVQLALQSQGISVTPKEARDVVALLETGEFFGDLTSATSAIFRTIPRIPGALLKDVPTIPLQPIRILGALFADLGDQLGGLRELVRDVADNGRLDTPPTVLRRTLSTVYGVASVATTRDLIRELLDPKNRSIRLALILYARSNGIPLTEEHIDIVRDTVLDGDQPDLGPAIAAAAEFLKARYAPEELDDVLGALRTQPPLG